MRRTIIIGGGTFSHVRNHLSLAAPAFGSTAVQMYSNLYQSEIVLTKMADNKSDIVTNQDLSDVIDKLIADKSVGTIIMNAAVCDFDGKILNDNLESGSHAKRLKTACGQQMMELTPSEKIIGRIRIARPDIFLVGFKTTTGESSTGQFLTGLKMMKSVKCNLVLANDVVTRNNMIITPEETRYNETTDRGEAITELCEMIRLRQNLTYHRTNLVEMENFPMTATPQCFQDVVKFLTLHGGFIENNSNGFTPGHFCYKLHQGTFLSSQRKADHTLVFTEGLSKVISTHFGQDVYGTRKASVGATSQQLIFNKFPDYDCIVHTHNPRTPESDLPVTPQRPYQCGSIECGINTVDHMKKYDDDIAAVFLEKHGANILFRSDADPQKIIDFIRHHLQLGVKES